MVISETMTRAVRLACTPIRGAEAIDAAERVDWRSDGRACRLRHQGIPRHADDTVAGDTWGSHPPGAALLPNLF